MSYNVIDAAKDLLTGNLEYVTKQQKAERMAICSKCEHRTMIGLCGICGCILEMKTALKKSGCPDAPPRWYPIL